MKKILLVVSLLIPTISNAESSFCPSGIEFTVGPIVKTWTATMVGPYPSGACMEAAINGASGANTPTLASLCVAGGGFFLEQDDTVTASTGPTAGPNGVTCTATVESIGICCEGPVPVVF